MPMHEIGKVEAVNAQHSNHQICCYHPHPPGQVFVLKIPHRTYLKNLVSLLISKGNQVFLVSMPNCCYNFQLESKNPTTNQKANSKKAIPRTARTSSWLK